MKVRFVVGCAALAGLVGVTLGVARLLDSDAPSDAAPASGAAAPDAPAASKPGATPRPTPEQARAYLGDSLFQGLQNTPGCLGVDAAQTSSGKNVIFAWFENKAAALAWHRSAVHKKAMHDLFPDSPRAAPLDGVPDNIPILAIASITMSDKPHFEETPLPISQIAIELYTPIKGGIHLGGTFAPEGLKVEGIRDLTKVN